VTEALASLRQAYLREARDPASRVTALSVPPEVEFTDTGNAQRLARLYGWRLRYVPEWGWLAYSGGRWVRQADGHAMQCAKACVREMLQEAATCAEGRRQMDLLDHARRSLSEPRLQAMLRLARSEPGIAAQLHDFDADPYLLNVLNGTLDLHTGELRDHQPADLLTKMAHVTFDPQGTAPRWDQFLGEVFRSDQDLIAYVQRALGYTLTGDTSEQVFFTCFGSGANGKSTLLGVMMRILGDYAKPLKADALMSNPYGNGSSANPEIAALVGARFVTAQEPKGGELDTPKVKELTGGDPMQVRELHKMPFTLVPLFKLWMSTNERPTVRETTTGIWRRIRLIPFTVSFEGRREEGLSEKLASEASGILNWLLAGCLAWQRDGLGDATAVKDATREYREEEDEYLAFFEDVLVPDEDGRVEQKVAYEAFLQWQRANGVPYLSDKEFPKRAEARNYRKQRANGKRWLRGCHLVRSADSAASEPDSSKSSIRVNQESFSESGPTSALPTLPSIADLSDELPNF